MTTAILNSLKNGAYTAIALYVVFVAVITVTSMNAASINAIQTSGHAPIVVAEGAAVSVSGGA